MKLHSFESPSLEKAKFYYKTLRDDTCFECVVEIVGMFDDNALYTSVYSAESAFDFGYHTFVNGAIGAQGGKALAVDGGDDAVVIVYISEHTILLKAEDEVGGLYL